MLRIASVFPCLFLWLIVCSLIRLFLRALVCSHLLSFPGLHQLAVVSPLYGVLVLINPTRDKEPETDEKKVPSFNVFFPPSSVAFAEL